MDENGRKFGIQTHIIGDFRGFDASGVPVIKKPGDPLPRVVFKAKPQTPESLPSLAPSRTTVKVASELPVAG